jgi:hypothetical protein
VVQQEVREQVGLDIAKRGYGTLAGGHGRSVAERAAISRLMSCEYSFFLRCHFPSHLYPSECPFDDRASQANRVSHLTDVVKRRRCSRALQLAVRPAAAKMIELRGDHWAVAVTLWSEDGRPG